MAEIIFVLFIVALAAITFIWLKVAPKIDTNYITEEKILWYNDPFDFYVRKHIVLWKIKAT